jgi:hypothetical protein
MYQHPGLKPMWGIAGVTYSTPSDVIFSKPDGSKLVMKLKEGFNQGGPLASILFSFC